MEVSLCYQSLLNSDEFFQSIIDCTDQLGSTNYIHSSVYKDSFTITSFSNGTLTPFSSFQSTDNKVVIVTGLLENPFVVSNYKKVFDNSERDDIVAMETNAQSLPLQLARYLLSNYVIYCRHDNGIQRQQLPSLWFLCDSIIAIGVTITSEEILFYQIIKNNQIIKNTKTKSFSINPNAILPVDNQLMTTPTYRMFSRYEFGPLIDDDLSVIRSQLVLEFNWESGSSMISSPSNSSNVLLSVLSLPGYQFSPLVTIFNEIQSLVHLTEVAMGTKEWSSLHANDEFILQATQSSYHSIITSFLSDYNTGSSSTSMRIMSPSVQSTLFQSREDTDFLDQLWTISHVHVTNSDDLIAGLADIFMSVLKGRIQPFIHPTSTSKCAQLLSQSLSTSSKDRRQVIASKLQSLLSTDKCLMALVEIGIDKLERDYIWYFVSKGFVSLSDMKEFIGGASIIKRLRNLQSVHCVLELTANLLTYLSLPQSTMTAFVRQTMSYYKQSPVDRFQVTPTFTVSFNELSEIKLLTSLVSTVTPSLVSVATPSNGKRHQMFVSVSEPLFKYHNETVEENEQEDNLYSYYANCQHVPI